MCGFAFFWRVDPASSFPATSDVLKTGGCCDQSAGEDVCKKAAVIVPA